MDNEKNLDVLHLAKCISEKALLVHYTTGADKEYHAVDRDLYIERLLKLLGKDS